LPDFVGESIFFDFVGIVLFFVEEMVFLGYFFGHKGSIVDEVFYTVTFAFSNAYFVEVNVFTLIFFKI